MLKYSFRLLVKYSGIKDELKFGKEKSNAELISSTKIALKIAERKMEDL